MAAPSREAPISSASFGESGNLLSFSSETYPPGISIVDHIEHRRSRIEIPTEVDLSEADTNSFYMPVDRGVTFSTERMTIPHSAAVFIRNSWGLMVDELSNGDSREFPEDRYSVEITASIKLYIDFTDEFSIAVHDDQILIEFNELVETAVGARSHHKNPAGTITVSNDPEDLMKAISHLGSSLKTLDCERSYPTLRGHPPTIELGDELDVPEYIESPDTGVTIEVPPVIDDLFVIAPLVYYLGADVVEGEIPIIRTISGFSHSLETADRGFEAEVERVLKQVFFLDCLTRTEGYYKVELAERNRVEPYVDLDFSALYEASIAEQLEEYLSVPYESIKAEIPDWKLTAHIEPDPENVEYLPFLIQDLAIIRTAKGEPITPGDVGAKAIEDFVRNGAYLRSSTDSATRSTSPNQVPDSLVDPVDVESLEHAWVGDGVPVGASKALIEAFEHRLDKAPTSDQIEITVICNDQNMSNERKIVNHVYGSREELSFDVNIHNQLTVEELRTILKTDIDFLHYIGHIDEDGFECRDGRLDVSKMDISGVDSFFLNACTSYRQGKALIELGSIAGVVTLNEVVNSGAEMVGKSLAKLLNQGFPLRAALSVAQTQSIMGHQYIVLGDGNADIAQPESGTALLLGMDSGDGGASLEIQTFPTGDRNIGSMFIPYLDGYEVYHLCSGKLGPFKVSRQTLEEYFDRENFPLLKNKTLHWTGEAELSELIG